MPITRKVPYRPIGSHTSDNTFATASVITLDSRANGILLQCFIQNIRYTLDGTTPTASLGFQLLAGAEPRLIELSDTTTLTIIEELITAVVQYQFVDGV